MVQDPIYGVTCGLQGEMFRHHNKIMSFHSIPLLVFQLPCFEKHFSEVPRVVENIAFVTKGTLFTQKYPRNILDCTTKLVLNIDITIIEAKYQYYKNIARLISIKKYRASTWKYRFGRYIEH